MGQRKRKQRRPQAISGERQASASEVDERGPVSARFYWVMGVVALAGAALWIAALLPADRGTSASSAAMPDPPTPSVPAQYDSLGVTLGPEDAPVVVREFADYQCPACRQFAPTMRRLREELVGSGQVRIVFFDLPITSAHPNALAAAQAARCAGRQGSYWAMHDALFERQEDWAGMADPSAAFGRYAREVGLDAAAFADCLTSGATLPEVRRSAEFAGAIGVSSTPTVVVGDLGFAGVRSYAEVRSLIDAQLRTGVSAAADPPPLRRP
ncbi:MAG: thioredoxin domain-containing protein [Gemmatimonadetes bacterium]|nr:thioredoxin domain-containing protein [Gemmatimonadota bacterium]